MAVTTKIPPQEVAPLFDLFTKRFLRDDSPEVATIEFLSAELGEQHVAENAVLLGITYDKHSRALEFAFESGDHRVYQPDEVWTLEDPDGFISSIELVRPDGAREIVTLKRIEARSERR